MPTSRMLITLGEVKEIVANKFGITKKEVGVYGGYEQICGKMCGADFDIGDNTYILEYDDRERKNDCDVIKLHSKILANPWMRDPDYLSVWIHLLLLATHVPQEDIFGGKRIILRPGQLITGRRSISSLSGVNEHKVERILKCFENENQIKQQASNSNRLITITNWAKYQEDDQ